MKKILFAIVLLIVYVGTTAQQAFTNNGNLQIHTGAQVTGFADFTNSSSAALVP